MYTFIFIAPLWNQPFSEIHLAKLAAHIDDWRAISPLLGLTAADDSAILGEAPHSVPTQRAAMLRRWKQIQGKKATYGRLYQVFEQCKRADLVEKVKQLVADLPKESKLTKLAWQLTMLLTIIIGFYYFAIFFFFSPKQNFLITKIRNRHVV